jgi:phospholipid-translocating ATPase
LFKEIYWSDLKCGDIILVEDNEHFSADILLILSSAENGECFVQTSSLDGERALKHKQCLEPIDKAIDDNSLVDFKCSIHCEAPNKNLYSFSGYLESE